MELKGLCKGIQLPAEACKRVLEEYEKVNLAEMERQLNNLMERGTAEKAYHQLVNCLGKDPGNMKMLMCQLVCACRDYDRYRELGISDEIYFDTMKCFTRFLGERRERTGEVLFDRGWWTYRQVSMTLLRIGELEYELTAFEGKDAISIHIPSDAAFIPEEVEESLRMAEDFIRGVYPEYVGAEYFCESWLLSPRLAELVKETSNIRKFQKRFVIKEDLPEDKEYMEWLFGKTPDTPLEELPENTSLQRKAKVLLENGGNLGAGVGILTKTFTLEN